MSSHDIAVSVLLFGEDLRFWATVCIASLVKWLFTRVKQTSKEAIAGILAGAMSAYYGHEWVIRNFDGLSEQDKSIVVIGLVITGEHIVRILMTHAPAKIHEKLGLEQKEEKP